MFEQQPGGQQQQEEQQEIGPMGSSLSREVLRRHFIRDEARAVLVANRIWGVPSEAQLQQLEETLGFAFKDRPLLRLALLHSSADAGVSNVKLAWIGDSALTHMMTDTLLMLGWGMPVGQLTQLRSKYVSRDVYRRHGLFLNLSAYLILGKTITPKERESQEAAWLPEAFEAVLGAVYVDGGYDAMRAVYTRHFSVSKAQLEQDIAGILADVQAS